MRLAARNFLLAALALALLAGCATRELPRYEPPLARTAFQNVRTTAYTHTEADHRKYSNHNALGSTLRYGQIKSASADWSRWPAGTVFRLLETNEIFRVDDYGWAICGTNTIDLYKPTRATMNRWGVRRVNIEILQWGDDRASYAVLVPRAKHRHVRRMLADLRKGGRV